MKTDRADGRRPHASEKHGWPNLPVEGTRNYRHARLRWWLDLALGLSIAVAVGAALLALIWVLA